jgi:ubiquinone/menaquinone biosynthesis C-methylase UbiE
MTKNLCLLLTAMMVGATAWTRAQVAHQHHPPESTSAYIEALEDPARADWQKPEEVVAHLNLKADETVADIGAGSGYFTLRLARAVGPGGRVYAVDIDRGMLEYIEQRARRERLGNIQTVLASPHDPQLPASSLDLVFICDTLHHISDREKYYPLLARALKPGGRFVDVDFHKRPLPIGPSVEMKIAKSALIEEARPAGFHLVKEYDFLPYQYFVVFQR